VIEGIHNRSLTSEAFGKNAARALRDVEDPKEKDSIQFNKLYLGFLASNIRVRQAT
jgi:hypothetical protein